MYSVDLNYTSELHGQHYDVCRALITFSCLALRLVTVTLEREINEAEIAHEIANAYNQSVSKNNVVIIRLLTFTMQLTSFIQTERERLIYLFNFIQTIFLLLLLKIMCILLPDSSLKVIKDTQKDTSDLQIL